MSRNILINVQGFDINVTQMNQQDFICLTDMAKYKDNDSRAADIIKNWIRNRSTIEFLGTWEVINNPAFKVVEFDHFKKEAGLPTFVMSVSNWIEKTNAIGIYSKKGKYGGTYAHKDIAFEFGSAISPAFKLYLIKEFQRLKEQESDSLNIEWNIKRVLTKVNYQLHTLAIKDYIIPQLNIEKEKEFLVYASEADLLNVALFGCTAKSWREANPKSALEGMNIRDISSINELAVLSNLESLNSEMIKSGMDKTYRLHRMKEIAKQQLEVLKNVDYEKSYKKLADITQNKMDKPKKSEKE